MIFFANSEGTISQMSPDDVHQWSTNANEIVLIAPWTGVAVTVCFTLPNGIVTTEKLMTQMPYIPELGSNNYRAWRYLLEQEITEYSGIATAQFFGRNGNGMPTSGACNFRIGNGVSPAILPDTPSQTIYEQILEYLGLILGEIEILKEGSYIDRVTFEDGILSIFVVTFEEQGDGSRTRVFSVDLNSLSDGAVTGMSFNRSTGFLELSLKGNPSKRTVDLSTLRERGLSRIDFRGDVVYFYLVGVAEPLVLDLRTFKAEASADGVADFYSQQGSDDVYLETNGGEAFVVNLAKLRNGELRGARLGNNFKLFFATDNGRGGTEEIYSVDLSTLASDLEDVYFDQETNELVFVYRSSQGDKEARIDLTDFIGDINFDTDLNIKDGEGNNSLVQKLPQDAYRQNAALSDSTAAWGGATTAGCKGFFIKSIDTTNKKIYVTRTQTTPVFSTAVNTEDGIVVPAVWVNQFLTFVSGNHYNPRFIPNGNGFDVEGVRVLSVSGNVISYSGDIPFSSFSADNGYDGNTVSCRMYFDASREGLVPLGYGAISSGVGVLSAGGCADGGGAETIAHADYSFARNLRTRASYGATSFGHGTAANGNFSFSANEFTDASGGASAAFGGGSKTLPDTWAAFASGQNCIAGGNGSNAGNVQTKALGRASTSRGLLTEATGEAATSEGTETKATAASAHAGGWKTEAKHTGAFTHGSNLQSGAAWQAVFGKFNAPNSSDLITVGDGTSARPHNCFRAGNNGAQSYLAVGDTVLTEAMLKAIIDTGMTWPIFDGAVVIS